MNTLTIEICSYRDNVTVLDSSALHWATFEWFQRHCFSLGHPNRSNVVRFFRPSASESTPLSDNAAHWLMFNISRSVRVFQTLVCYCAGCQGQR